MAEETLDDHLSQFPDSLLVQILSLLPTKEAFRTFSKEHNIGRYGGSGCRNCELTVRLSCVGNYFFRKVRGFRRLEINSLKVKSLKLEGYWYDDGRSESDHFFEIFAPHLHHLELSHDFHDFKCSLMDVSSLVNAKITFDITCIKDLQDNPDEDSNEEEEYSCSDYHQGLMHIAVQRDANSRIGMQTSRAGVAFRKFDDSRCYFERSYLVKGDRIGSHSHISSIVFPNLKNVKIVVSPGMCIKEHLEWEYMKKLFKLSEFLLKNAAILEKFIIISNGRSGNFLGSNIVIAWKSLKSITLEDMELVDAEIVNLLSGCPALETILFHKCRLVDVSSMAKDLQDDPDQDSDEEEDSCNEYHQDSDDEEDSCSDYYQDSDEEDNFDLDSDDEEDSCGDYYQDSDMEEDNPDEDSD
ncbi:hypothetical protein HAX54_033860 [Datura stramonium]|uniref:Uncharacterized protein n=1 Tax=Datura stramonium TaxID=4076 RepID=A0ABS8VDR2_DATST|nr:hypothetical protein [Datura stramonium]